LLGCLDGDEEAAQHFYAALGPVLLAYARALLRDSDRAADVVQESLCRLLQLPESRIADMRDVQAYVIGMVRNEARAHLRRGRHGEVSGANQRERDADSGRESIDLDLADAIEALSTPLREVVVLKHVAGLTFDQMALATGENRNTLASRHQQALRALRAQLSKPSLGTEVNHVR
jgi:RNA polymerase sigma-70 factor, ECF subfamily